MKCFLRQSYYVRKTVLSIIKPQSTINFRVNMSVSFHFICRKASLAAAFMLFLQVAYSQKKSAAPSPFPVLDKAIEEKKASLGKDFSVIIAFPDSIVYQKNIGDPANVRTPFLIDASSQWLTAALIMQLVDEGKVSLDDPVAKYLPVFESYGRNYVTLRHCLAHQTGLGQDNFKQSALFEKRKFNSLEEEVTDILKKEIHANAGQEFRYTAYGPIIAARVAEVVTKKRFDQIIRTKLFVPLGMRNTSFAKEDGSAPDPTGGAKSTPIDFIRFLQMILNRGKAGDKQILSEASAEELRNVQAAAGQLGTIPKIDEGFSFALGSWSADGNIATGSKADLLVSPSLSGTWPLIDFSKGYALLVFARDFSGEQKPEVYLELKKLVDQEIASVRK